MATLAIGLAGSFLGSTVGLGGVGFIAGSVLANLLFPGEGVVTEGPRLGDTSVSASTYGLPIPLGYGTFRMSGNMIWSSGIIEQRNTETVGGKGGLGGPQGTQITYTYFASFAMSFAGREARDVIRIYADSKLLFDKSAAANVRKPGLRFRFYGGSEDQLPDSLIEADKGVGQVPAHRDLCYIVFENLDLTDFGNRIPNITAEIAFNVAGASVATRSTDLLPNQSYDNNVLIVDRQRRRIYIEASGLRVFNYDTLAEFRRPSVPIIPLFGESWEAGRFTGNLYTSGTGNGSPVFKISPDTFGELARFGFNTLSTSNTTTTFGTAKALIEAQAFTLVGGVRNFLFQVAAFNDLGLLDADDMTYIWHLDNSFLQENTVTGLNTLFRQQSESVVFWILNQGGAGNSPLYIYKLEVLAGARYDASLQVTFGVDLSLAATIPASTWNNIGVSRVSGPIIDQEDDGLILGLSTSQGCHVFKWIEDEGVVWSTPISDRPYRGGQSFVKGSFVVDGRLGWLTQTNLATIVDTRTGEVVFTSNTIETDLNVDVALGSLLWDGEADAAVMHNVTGSDIVRVALDRASGEGELLSTVVRDLSERVDFAPTDLSVGALTDVVSGYVVARQVSSREAIEPLSQTFFFDGVESDDLVKFVKRGGAPALTIPQAHLVELDDEGRVFPEDRTQEIDLPERLSVVYADRALNYGQGTQSFKRTRQPTPVVRSRAEQSLELALVLTATEAQQLAERLLVSGWSERSGRRWTTGQRYLALEPTDVVQVQLDSGLTLTARVSNVGVGEDLTLEFEGVNEASQTFLSDAVSQNPIGVPATRLPSPASSLLFQLNVPLLRDIDDTGGALSRNYFGLAGYRPGFDGGYLLQSLDGGSSYEELAKALSGLPWGVISNRLPATTTPFQTDTTTTLNVFMQVGDLQSVTNAQLLANANVAIVGSPTTNVWEIILYKDAIEGVDGVYEVSTLVRARRGTDPFVNDHADGEFFIPVSTDTLFAYTLEIGQIDTAIPYKGVGFGQVQELVPVASHTALGRDLQPYAPVFLDAVLNGNDIDLSWTRRTRVGGELRDGTGTVPLGETSESYDVVIKDGPAGNVLRTVAGVTSSTYKYLNADIVTDFGFVPNNLTFEVFQNSAAVGRGFGSEATITVSEFTADPNFFSVVFLCSFEGPDESTSATDDSNVGNSIVFVGGVRIDTAKSRFGLSSLRNNTTNSVVRVPQSDSFDLGAGPFTIEFFFNNSTNIGGFDAHLVGVWDRVNGQRGWKIQLRNAVALEFEISTDGNSAVTVLSHAFTPTLDQWYYVVVDYDGTTYRMYLDTVQVASDATTQYTIFNANENLTISSEEGGDFRMIGHIDEVRITKGVARYQGTVPTPTAPFPRPT